MRHYNAHHNEDGFTLLELIIVIIVSGILAAVSVPSFLASNRNNQLNNDLASAKSALLESQRDAMRIGKTCTISLSTGTPPEISNPTATTANNCLSTGTRTLSNVSMNAYKDVTGSASISVSSLTFDFLGNLNETAPITIVLRHNSNSGDRKCIVISQPLGLIATGKYTDASDTYSSNCTP
jgi:prepilin-type N-terminal cleavage/methylation domain-containing protein